MDQWLKNNKNGAPYTTLQHEEKLSLALLLRQKMADPGQIARCLAISRVVPENLKNAHDLGRSRKCPS